MWVETNTKTQDLEQGHNTILMYWNGIKLELVTNSNNKSKVKCIEDISVNCSGETVLSGNHWGLKPDCGDWASASRMAGCTGTASLAPGDVRLPRSPLPPSTSLGLTPSWKELQALDSQRHVNTHLRLGTRHRSLTWREAGRTSCWDSLLNFLAFEMENEEM